MPIPRCAPSISTSRCAGGKGDLRRRQGRRLRHPHAARAAGGPAAPAISSTRTGWRARSRLGASLRTGATTGARSNGEKVGIAILDHPANPRHPVRWHVRGYGLFAANPFGLSVFTNDKSQDGAMTVEPGQTPALPLPRDRPPGRREDGRHRRVMGALHHGQARQQLNSPLARVAMRRLLLLFDFRRAAGRSARVAAGTRRRIAAGGRRRRVGAHRENHRSAVLRHG